MISVLMRFLRWFFTPYNALGDSPFGMFLCGLMMIIWVFGLPWIIRALRALTR